MSNSSTHRQLIVCGFHRSGTSLTMQALQNAGLFLGNNLMPPHPSNPDGHFENRSIVSLHDELLSTRGRHWYSEGSTITDIDDNFTVRAGEIIQGYTAESSTWGFKDPRSCLFLDWWHSLLAQPGAVLIYRNYLACYQSLRNREAQSLAYKPTDSLHFWQDPLLGFRLWLDYNKALLSYAEQHRDTTLLVSCEAMLSGFDLVSAVNAKFALSLDPAACSGIRTGAAAVLQYRSVHAKIPEALLTELQQTLHSLNSLADSPEVNMPELLTPQPIDTDAERNNTRQWLSELELKPAVISTQQAAKYIAQTQPSETHKESVQTQAVADKDPQVLLRLIQSLDDSIALAKASEFIETCIRLHPKDLKLRIAAGRHYLQCNAFESAEQHFLAAKKLNPENPGPLLQLGFLQNTRKSFQEAVEYFEQALAQQRQNPIIHFHLCNALINTGQHKMALKQCEAGLLAAPDNQKLQERKIFILLKCDLLTTAEQYCRRLLNANPQCIDCNTHYANIQARLGNSASALHYFYIATWQKMLTNPDYALQLFNAIGSLSLPAESAALHHQVNHELKELSSQIHRQLHPVPPSPLTITRYLEHR